MANNNMESRGHVHVHVHECAVSDGNTEGCRKLKRSSSKVTPLDIESTYNLLDKELDGTVSPPVLQQSLANLGLPSTPSDCDIIYQEITENGRQEFDESSFQTWVEGNCPEIEPDEISVEAFRTLDKDGDGYINCEDLRVGLPPLGLNISDKILQLMFNEADRNNVGKLCYDDFLNIIGAT